MKNALKDLNLSVSIVEWFQDIENLPKGTARLIFYEQNINYSQGQYEAVESLIEQIKRLSLLLVFEVQAALLGSAYVAKTLHRVERSYIK